MNVKTSFAVVAVLLVGTSGMVNQALASSMVPGFPDAIEIGVDAFYVIHAGDGLTVTVYRHIVNGNDSSAHQIIFNRADGSFNSCLGIGCSEGNKSITQFINEGKAFYLVNDPVDLQPILNRLATLESQTNSLDLRTTAVENRLTVTESDIDIVETQLTSIDTRVEQNTDDILDIRSLFVNIKTAIENFLTGT